MFNQYLTQKILEYSINFIGEYIEATPKLKALCMELFKTTDPVMIAFSAKSLLEKFIEENQTTAVTGISDRNDHRK